MGSSPSEASKKEIEYATMKRLDGVDCQNHKRYEINHSQVTKPPLMKPEVIKKPEREQPIRRKPKVPL